MSRLIAFGCSHTYGQNLSDCLDSNPTDGLTPSNFAWPTVLANMLEKQVVNVSKKGNSNIGILYDILNFNFEEDDQVVILWTVVHRDIIFRKTKENFKIGTWLLNDKTYKQLFENWALLHSNYDLEIRSSIYMHHAEIYLEKLNLKNISLLAGCFDQTWKYRQSKTNNINVPDNLKLQNFKDLKFDDICDNYGILPCRHPTLAAHVKIAETIFNFIND